MSKARSKLIDYKSREFRTARGFTTEVHFGKQEKHLAGRPAHDPTKSYLTIGIKEIQRLVEEKSGTGRWEGDHKEVVDVGIEIGVYLGRRGGAGKPTTRATIHYSRTGAHIVPAAPTPTRGTTS